MRHNKAGNWAPTGIEIYTVTLDRDLHKVPQGEEIEVVESQHPSFTNHWQILRRESCFIRKEFVKTIV